MLALPILSYADPCEEMVFSDPKVLAEEMVFSDPKAFAKAMTEGLLLREGQDSLFEFYVRNFYAYPDWSYGWLLKDVLHILKEHPWLFKLPVREHLLEWPIREKEHPQSLKNFINSWTHSAGQIQSRLFQISANLGFWVKMLGFSSKEDFIAYLNSTALNQHKRDFIKDTAKPYHERVMVLFQALGEIRNSLFLARPKTGMPILAVQRISQAMANLVHTYGFGHEHYKAKLKSSNPETALRALQHIFKQRDKVAHELGFNNFFELKTSLGAKIEEIEPYLNQIEVDIQSQPDTIKKKEVLRLRALSLQESAFRSCMGRDCATSQYFKTALAPHYLYWTLTDKNHQSSGQVTVVLGTAVSLALQEVKVAFVDKIQSVRIDQIPAMLEGIRLSLKEKGYILALPKKVGCHNCLSNSEHIRHYVEFEILPFLKKSLRTFKPHTHSLSHNPAFNSLFSRANDKLDLWEFEGFDLQDVQIKAGLIHKPKVASSSLTAGSLYADILSLKKSQKDEEQIQFLNNLLTMHSARDWDINVSVRDVRDHLHSVLKNRSFSFPVRKQAFFKLIQFEMNKQSRIPWRILATVNGFSDKEIISLIGEMSNWKETTGYRKIFINELNSYNSSNPLKYSWDQAFNKGNILNHFRSFWNSKWSLLADLDKNVMLLSAVVAGHIGAIQVLLDKGADINANNQMEATTLMKAIQHKQVKVIQFLLDKGADIKALDKWGRPTFILAVHTWDKKIIQMLLERGADPNEQGRFWKTALMISAEAGLKKIVQLLLDYGANPNVKNQDGETAYDLAKQQGHHEVAQMLR